MESLGDEPWDVVICGTGLQQSLLALALSRSDKRVLHLDPNDYYGDLEAALSLEDADAWAAAGGRSRLIANASTWTHPDPGAHGGLRAARSYALALAPQIIHTRSALLSQLVSSRAYRQVEFLAVGSFFVFEQSSKDAENKGQLSRIPSSREDVFSTQAIPARSKRSLMKFLKFVVNYDSEEERPMWLEHGSEKLAQFLQEQFKLDDSLRQYILALTLTLDGDITVRDGLAIIHRHLSSLGWFGPGFCAVYPKWGGGSEIAQVACRAGAVGGGIYMLDTGMEMSDQDAAARDKISLKLSSGTIVQTSALITSQDEPGEDALTIKRLIAVVNTTFAELFEVVVEGAPKPAVAVISLTPADAASPLPVYAFVHSSDTGECPSGQSVVYLTTLATEDAQKRLDSALETLLTQVATSQPSDAASTSPVCLYKLVYDQSASRREAVTIPLVSPSSASADAPSGKPAARERVHHKLPSPALDLSFRDDTLDHVREAWRKVVATFEVGGIPDEEEYMNFEDREGPDGYDDDEVYE
ncbi:GDP dissociation inhibitor-domain-containing protein [Microdochium trichocladiopsis]|uniref:Rab proteins geranylgeranyltransferase n=1 Tax=Microdochium trichocladiopsis TaxID=1682393 RepID=A0A9P8YEL1_9PEZI|nr:GDP dissociation inhibitor-domain-containing protein [Microdochium trichocladiopsis]KAH7037457.1 GDP dissociation inhibitor-domain-containing protein [Microdochium trichocladiopsis]